MSLALLACPVDLVSLAGRRRVHFVLGMSRGKNYGQCIDTLRNFPHTSALHLVSAKHHRYAWSVGLAVVVL